MQRVIKEWFLLVDDDGSGTLEHHELLAALQVSLYPVCSQSVTAAAAAVAAAHVPEEKEQKQHKQHRQVLPLFSSPAGCAHPMRCRQHH